MEWPVFAICARLRHSIGVPISHNDGPETQGRTNASGNSKYTSPPSSPRWFNGLCATRVLQQIK